jgi:hypothetical protein
MLFYFAWIDEADSFNPQIHARQDEEIFNLQLAEQEGLFPTAMVTVQQIKQKPKPFAFISCQIDGQVHLLFKGRLVQCPLVLQAETLTYQLVAEPSDADQQLKALAHTMQVFPYYDPLFLAADRRLDPDIHELLDARDDLLYWSRTLDGVCLSNIFQGRQTLDLSDHIFADSLAIQLTDAPLNQIDVALQIQWRQKFRGEAVLDHLIQAALPEGMITTLTGADLEARWWQDGDAIGRSGYHLSHSKLEKVDRKYATASFMLSPDDPLAKEKVPRKVRLKKNWYRPQLKVNWRYCQKRVEKLFFTLRNDVQPLGYHANRKRTLRIQLHDVVAAENYIEWLANRMHLRGEKVIQAGRLFLCLRTHRAGNAFEADVVNWQDLGPYQVSGAAEMRGTFFATDRGVQAVEHAIEIARAHLAASSRAVEIKFECDMKDAMALTCDHTVTLADLRLPGKRVTGKVKKLAFEVAGETGCATASITLACALGTGKQHKIQPQAQTIFAEQYFDDNVIEEVRSHQTISGVNYESFLNQVPDRGHVFPAFLGARDILRGVTLVNNAEEQETHLKQHQHPHGQNLQQALRQVKTGVKLWFEDLQSVGSLEHHIQVQIPHPWSAPKQITL